MGVSNEGKLVISVGMNEGVGRADNPNVPLLPDEIAADAIACAKAGAAIVHFHARTGEGGQAKYDDGAYRAALHGIAAGSELLAFPTSFPRGLDPTDPDDAPHFWPIAADPLANKPQLLPFDCFRIGSPPALVDGKLAPLSIFGQGGDSWSAPRILTAIEDAGAVPLFVCFHPGDVRWVLQLAREKRFKSLPLVQFQFFGQMLWGSSPTPAALDAYIDEWDPAIDAELMLAVQGLTDPAAFYAITDHAISRGVGVRAGLGDNPAIFPHARNAELVADLAERVGKAGYTPAAAGDLRVRLRGTLAEAA